MKKYLLAAMILIWGGNYAFGTTNEIPMQIINKSSGAGGNYYGNVTLYPLRRIRTPSCSLRHYLLL